MQMERMPILVLHGGAGVPDHLSAEADRLVRNGLRNALDEGFRVLRTGGSALDAVETAVRIMEDDPVFNAGIGGALTSHGHVEHDAAIMDGATRMAGAVTGTRRIRNPITLARRVMDASPHVFLSGSGAEDFARRIGVSLVDPEIFITPQRVEALRRVQAGLPRHALNEQDLHGTVGAVALDIDGHLAAATSTGGYTNKWPGRVGDSPLIGAGTYASDRSVAVSCTGHGEYFIRCVTAHRVSTFVELGGMGIEDAAAAALAEVAALGGRGGLIAIDRAGRYAMPFNGRGMYRGFARWDGAMEILVH